MPGANSASLAGIRGGISFSGYEYASSENMARPVLATVETRTEPSPLFMAELLIVNEAGHASYVSRIAVNISHSVRQPTC